MSTHIEWTCGDDGSAGMTWNPTTGCDRVSAGCDNCYALTMAARLKGMGQAKYQRDGDPRTSGPGFGLTVHEDTLSLPLKWRKPKRVFVNSMSDLFHTDVPDEFIARVWAVMATTPKHTYQILTKRHGRMRSLLSSDTFRRSVQRRIPHVGDDPYIDRHYKAWPLPNVWLGVSVEEQKHADLRIHALLETPAAVHFISAEPLLGPVDLTGLTAGGGARIDCLRGDVLDRKGTIYAACPTVIDWVIAGGESGPGARPMQVEWARSLVKQATDAGIACFVKQMGSVWARKNSADNKGGDPSFWPEDLRIRQFPVVTP